MLLEEEGELLLVVDSVLGDGALGLVASVLVGLLEEEELLSPDELFTDLLSFELDLSGLAVVDELLLLLSTLLLLSLWSPRLGLAELLAILLGAEFPPLSTLGL